MNDRPPLFKRIADFITSVHGGSVSRHLDEMPCSDDDFTYGLDYYLENFNNLVSLVRSNSDQRTVVWVFPICASNDIIISKPTEEELIKNIRASSVYLVDGRDIFIEASEEYRLAMNFSALRGDGHAVFRSWRDFHAAELGWEFNNDMYLWSPASAQPFKPVN